MVRERPALGTPFGTDGPWLAAILDVLGDLHDLLDARLPAAASAVRPVSEPATARPGREVVPVSEPAPDNTPAGPEPEPDVDEEPQTEEPQISEPEPAEGLPEPPPRAGRGSSLKAWQTFADRAGVEVPEGASRDDVIVACELAEVIPAE